MALKLTDKEIMEAAPVTDDYDVAGRQSVAQAQLEKVAKWGGESCSKHFEENNNKVMRKHTCLWCWQELCREA